MRDPIFPVAPSQAIAVARKYWATSVNDANLVACKDGLVWLVINRENLAEISISRSSGIPLTTTVLSQNIFEESSLLTTDELPVSAETAIRIAKDHFIKYGREKFNSGDDILSGFSGSSCDLGIYWRVVFAVDKISKMKSLAEISHLPNASPPDYLLEKSTGRIVYFSEADKNKKLIEIK